MSDEAVDSGGGEAVEGGRDAALRAFVDEGDDKGGETEPKKPAEKASGKPAGEWERKARPESGGESEREPDAKPEPKDKPTEKTEKRRYKVKLRGEEAEVDEDELVRGYQRASDASRTYQQAAKERQALERARELAKSDPAAALEALGVTSDGLKEFIQKRALESYTAEYDPATGQPLSEEQRRLRQLESELTSRKRAEEAEAERKKAEEAEAVKAEQIRHFTKAIVTRLEADKLPKSIMNRVAGHIFSAIEHDRSLNPDEILDDAVTASMEDIEQEHAHLFDAMEWPQIKARFPKLVQKVREGVVADYKAKRAQQVQPREEPEPQPEKRKHQRTQYTTARDVLRDFGAGR